MPSDQCLRHLSVLAAAAVALLTVGCADDGGNPTAPTSPSASTSTGSDSTARSALRQTKTDICHLKKKTGEYVPRSVSDRSLAKHLAHGDVVVGGVFDATCTPVPAPPAVCVLDQTFMPGLASSADIQNGSQLAQTFTVGSSGSLSEVDLSIILHDNPVPAGNLVISILPTSAGAPVVDQSQALATTIVPATLWAVRDTVPDSQTSRTVQFSSPFAVAAGDLLAIHVRQQVADSDLFFWLAGGSSAGYASGDPYGRSGALLAWTPLAGFDFALQTCVLP